MLRTALLKKLSTVSPALASNSLIPVLTRYWFTGDRIMAYNDAYGIWVPFESDYQGAIGNHIYDLLSASVANEIAIEQLNDGLQIKAGNTRLKTTLEPAELYEGFLALLPQPNVVWIAENENDKARVQKLVSAISCCLMSVSTDTSRAEHLGITFVAKSAEETDLYATSGKTMAHAKLDTTGWAAFKNRGILPTTFCELLVRFAKDAKKVGLGIYPDHAYLIADDVTVYSRLIDSGRPLDFPRILESLWPAEGHQAFIDVPQTFGGLVDRAGVITASKVERISTSVKVEGEVGKFFSKSERGELRDAIKLNGHPDVETTIEPTLIKEGITAFNKMLITPKCVLFAAEGRTFIAAAPGRN